MSGDAGSVPNSGGDVNRIEDLLDSPEWHEKLARAREQREKILAERAHMVSSAEKRRKPWEMPPPERKASRQAPAAFPRLEFAPEDLVRPHRGKEASGRVVPLPPVVLRDSPVEPDADLINASPAVAGDTSPTIAEDISISGAGGLHDRLTGADEFVLGTGFIGQRPHIKSERNDSTPNDAAASDDPRFQHTVSKILVARQETSQPETSQPRSGAGSALLLPDGAGHSDSRDDVWVPGLLVQPDIPADLPATVPADDLSPVAKPARSAGQRSLEAIPVSRTLDTLMPEPAVIAEATTGHRKAFVVMALVVAGAVIGAGLALMPGGDGPVTEQTAPVDGGTEASAASIELASGPATMTDIAAPSVPAPDSGTAISKSSSAAVPPTRGTALALPATDTPDSTLTAIPGSSRIATMSEIVDIAAPTVVVGQDAVAGFVGAQGGMGISPSGIAVERPAVSSLPAIGTSPAAFEPPTVFTIPALTEGTLALLAPEAGSDAMPDLPEEMAETGSLREVQQVAVPRPESDALPLITGTAQPLPAVQPEPDAGEPEATSAAPLSTPAPEPKPEALAPKVTAGIDLSGITVHMLLPSSLDISMLDQTAALLTGEGFAMAKPKAVDLKISVTQVRYYHAADAEAAAALAKLTNADPRDFTESGSRPPAGTVELWFAGQPDGSAQTAEPAAAKKSGGTAKAATKKATARRAAPAVDTESVVRDRVLRQLRGGEHLKKK